MFEIGKRLSITMVILASMPLHSRAKEKEEETGVLERLQVKDQAKEKARDESSSVQADHLGESRHANSGRWVSALVVKTAHFSIVLRKAVEQADLDLDERQLQ